MKSKFRTMVLAAAGVLASSAASAQPPPPPAPPAPPVTNPDPPAGAAPAPPTDQPAPPAAPPAAPVAPVVPVVPPTAAPPAAPGAAPALPPGSPDPSAPGAAPAAPPPTAGAAPAAPLLPGAPPLVPLAQPAEGPQPPPAAQIPFAPAMPPGDFAPAAVPPPPPVQQWGNAPPTGADTAPKPAQKPNPFRFSWLTWNQTATTTILGAGSNYQGSDGQSYTQDWTFTPRYYVLDTPTDQVSVSAELGWTTELTNSDTSTKLHETFFKDMALGVSYSHVIYQNEERPGLEKGEYKTVPGLGLRATLPTSEASRNESKYMLLSITPSLRQVVPLLGSKSDFLGTLIMSGSVGWSHLFARCYNACYEDLNRPRQDATGATVLSDQLSMKSFDQDRITLSFVYFFPIFKELYFANSWRFVHGFNHAWSPASIPLGTGPAQVQDPSGVNATTQNAATTFDVSLSYTFWDTVRVDVGYQNEADQLGLDSRYRGVFYSPDAAFYSDVIVMMESFYEKLVMNKQQQTLAFTPPSKVHF